MKFNINLLTFSGLFIFILIGLTSCGDIQQDFYLQKDGSGSLETTIDIGELMGMAKSFEDMGSAQDTFSDDATPDTIVAPPEPPKDEMTMLMEKITDPAHDKDFDTLMSFLSVMTDSIKEKETRLDLVEKMFVRIKSPAYSGDLKIGILLKFDNSQQLRDMISYMEKLNQSSDMLSGASPVSMDSETFMVFDADMKAGWVRFDTLIYKGFNVQMGMSTDTTMTSEDLGMMELMFGNSKIKSLIQIPGEVISCTNPDAILTKDNKVILEYPMMDAIKKGKIDGFTIHFKP